MVEKRIIKLEKEDGDKSWYINMLDPDIATQGEDIPHALRMLAEAYELFMEEE